MIRNLDYNWQNASNIVLVNNNNRGATAATTMTATMGSESMVSVGDDTGGGGGGGAMTTLDANGSSNNPICKNNNNEDGFGDKNYAAVATVSAATAVLTTTTSASLGGTLVTLVNSGSGIPKIVKIVTGKPQRPLSSGGGGRQSTVIVKMTNDKGRGSSTSKGTIVVAKATSNKNEELKKIAVEENSEVISKEDPEVIDTSLEVVVTPKATKTTTTTRSTLTPNTSSSNNSSFEESAAIAAGGSATSSPDHHARRPMNAFLIFCKKHRPIVREKYPNLENRAITKILGDWWANLEDKDQDPFKSLASNYKDAFLNANPNFKWYKLPAPPLRTLSTRPTNSDRSYGDLLAHGLPAASNNKSPSTPTKRLTYEEQYLELVVATPPPVHGNRRRGHKNNIQLFKLADENQMGGLSNLMAMGQQLPGAKDDNNNHNSPTTTAIGQELMTVHDDSDDLIIDESAAAEEPFANMRTHASRMEVTPKRKLVDVHSEFQAMKRAKKRADYLESAVASATTTTQGSLVAAEGTLTGSGQKSSRACKGKKYLEFFKQSKASSSSSAGNSPESPIAPGGPIGNGQQQTVIIRAPQMIMQPVGFPHNGYCKPQPAEGGQKAKKKRDVDPDMEVDIENETAEGKNEDIKEKEAEMEGDKMDQNNGKLFDASDFELDSKIIALPALNLDTYLLRKRETKKKKKIGGKGKNYTKKHSGPTIQQVKEAKQKAMVVGSQKRKARKESITRRDVNSVTTTTTTETVDEDHQGEGTTAGGATSDLFILATLAELQQ